MLPDPGSIRGQATQIICTFPVKFMNRPKKGIQATEFYWAVEPFREKQTIQSKSKVIMKMKLDAFLRK